MGSLLMRSIQKILVFITIAQPRMSLPCDMAVSVSTLLALKKFLAFQPST